MMKTNINSKLWWKAAGVRALKTIAQTALALLATATTLGQVDWVMVLSASVLAGLASVLTSIVGLPEVDQLESTETREDSKEDYSD